MAIIFYISMLLSPPFLLIWCAWRYGQSPKSKFAFIGRAPSVTFITAVLSAFYFVVLDEWGFEGTNSLVCIFYGINSAIVLAGFRGKKLWVLSFLVLVYSVSLDLFHSHLARSPDYTDSPRYRAQNIAVQNRKRSSLGLLPLPKVNCQPEWHTFLTQLYAVHPKP